MTRTIVTTLSAAAALAASPAFAACAAADAQRPYRASFDAARGLYCLQRFEAPAADPRPDYRRRQCRTEASWAREGIRFERAPAR